MIPNSSLHSLTKLFIKQGEYCSDVEIDGAYYIEKICIKI